MNQALVMSQARLAPSVAAPGQARGLVDELAVAPSNPELHAALQLILSELVTNAVVHGSGSVCVKLVQRGDFVVVEVSDSGQEPVQTRAPSDTETGGRGLALVEAVSSDWGVERTSRGTLVWCEVPIVKSGT